MSGISPFDVNKAAISQDFGNYIIAIRQVPALLTRHHREIAGCKVAKIRQACRSPQVEVENAATTARAAVGPAVAPATPARRLPKAAGTGPPIPVTVPTAGQIVPRAACSR